MCENLRFLYIPAGVTSVGDKAINYGYYRYALWHVLYGGTEDQWKLISKGKEVSLPKSASHYGCIGEEITLQSITSSNCEEKGSATYACATCQGTYQINLKALGHKWLDATCAAPKTCETCGKTEGNPLVHKFEAEVKEPTCTEPGGKYHTCTLCGEKKITDEVAALGHSYGQWVTLEEPSTDAPGLQERECSLCHEKETQQIPQLEPDNTLVIIAVVAVVVIGAVTAVLVIKKKKAV